MKNLILLLIIFTFVFVGIAYFWRLNAPVKDAELPTLKMMTELIEILNNASYDVGDYKKGIFDCSNESALLYDFLTNHGYHCTIVIGAWFERRWFPVVFHSWIIAEKEKKKMWVEASGKQVVYQKYFEDCFVLAHFKSLLILRIFSALCFLPSEWKY